MTEERPDETDRLESVSEAIESLQSLFADGRPLDELLDSVAASGAEAIPDADAVSITVLAEPTPRTAACTDKRVLRLDRAQYEAGRGPCLEAADVRRPVRAVMSLDEQRWPEFVAAASACGITATLSVPLLADRVGHEPELVGSLNIYSTTATAFDPFDEALMRLYTLTAGLLITNARHWQRSLETIDQLREALTSRSVIDQAKGALRAVHGCSEEEAFQRLVKESQNTNTKVHTVARDFLASLT
ncbi:hypothetical protein AU196_10885 [Mycobacterium sp. IS-1742]|nr:hypothetical protein AU196_10885 [Mycobacterium sp. IS-1742]